MEVTRRDFLKNALAVGAGAGALALVGCSTSNPDAAEGDVVTWDMEAEVVVVGYGGAGISAAIAAATDGGDVLALEKSPEALAGGNTSVSGGGWRAVVEGKEDAAVEFFRREMPLKGEGTITDAQLMGYVIEMRDNTKWINSLGIETTIPGEAGKVYPMLEGAEGIGGRVMCTDGDGYALYQHLKDYADDMDNIRVEWDCRVVDLIYEVGTKEVYGVVAEKDGALINVKASKAVILSLGGYEADPALRAQYIHPGANFIFQSGTPYNTGDGLKLMGLVGAKPRSFGTHELGHWCCAPASREAGCAISFAGVKTMFPHAIMVNKYGKRFMDENMRSGANYPVPIHSHYQLPCFDFDYDTVDYTHPPMYMVLDSVRFADGPLFPDASSQAVNTWAGIKKTWVWSDDNQKEVEGGYLLKGDTIEELAEKMGVDPATLAATVKKWNEDVAAGVDTEFGRTEDMDQLVEGPFYATELGVVLINTQGGPDRDEYHRVLNWDNEPVPRLYAGGEFGSIYGWLYQGSGNVGEALGNRTAGQHAVTLERWDAEDKA